MTEAPPPNLPIVVVGAGPAGCLAAIFAARSGRRVLLLERTRDGGRKILISGGGRCNILPSELDPTRFVTASSPHTLRKILGAWPLDDQKRFFEDDLGIPLLLEAETGKFFPASNRARDVRDGLLAMARRVGAEIRFDTVVSGLLPPSGDLPWRVDLGNGSHLDAAGLVLATGGLSVSATGSDGIGLRLARELGHTIHDTYPALTPLIADPPVHAGLAGVSLPVTLEARNHRTRFTTHGGLLFTHRGYSGPAVLDISHLAVRSRLAGGGRTPILVRWADLSADEWESRLTERSRALVHTRLRVHLPSRLAGQLLLESGIEPASRLSQLPREGRRTLIRSLTQYPLPWTGDEGYKKDEVTGGGVALSEVDPRTMESRIRPGFYLCGEMLDAFGPIGGYNFAWAWVTGRAAGLGAGRS